MVQVFKKVTLGFLEWYKYSRKLLQDFEKGTRLFRKLFKDFFEATRVFRITTPGFLVRDSSI